MQTNRLKDKAGYVCWLRYENLSDQPYAADYLKFLKKIVVKNPGRITRTAVDELKYAVKKAFGLNADVASQAPDEDHLYIELKNDGQKAPEAFSVRLEPQNNRLVVSSRDENGILYSVFHLLRCLGCGKTLMQAQTEQCPAVDLRIVEHWDNFSGDIERGYAGKSIFFENNTFVDDLSRIRDYARLLSSVSVNAVCINNVNVHRQETRFISDYLPQAARLANVFSDYGIRLFLSVNFAAPMEIGGLQSADPLDIEVKNWWKAIVDRIYEKIPHFGGFVVKADSENRPGPFTYGRSHAQGANMFADVLRPHNGLVVWRCFVYNCHLDWRDRRIDRAKAAYDHFYPLDGKFSKNVILQIKNGPMDFQIREPVSPLFGAMKKTNCAVEFQITQEYTGQQRHLCYLVPMWKEVLDFDTCARGQGSPVSKAVDRSLFGTCHGGIAGVSNIGNDVNWTGHPLAQANLYGFGRLAWNMGVSSKQIADEWARLTFGSNQRILGTIVPMLLSSRDVYEEYTSPLGVGWMVVPHDHYGPSVDGYEYSPWGTYHYADFAGLGVDRTRATGTGYTAQYYGPVADRYENLETCPEKLLLFFHHVPYDHMLKSGKTVLQHIYDTHFEGVERVKQYLEQWETLKGLIPEDIYEQGHERFQIQIKSAEEWRDVVNTYFYRKTGIDDAHKRKIYR